MRRWRKNTAGR